MTSFKLLLSFLYLFNFVTARVDTADKNKKKENCAYKPKVSLANCWETTKAVASFYKSLVMYVFSCFCLY